MTTTSARAGAARGPRRTSSPSSTMQATSPIAAKRWWKPSRLPLAPATRTRTVLNWRTIRAHSEGRAVAAAIIIAAPGIGAAQTYPNRVIKAIVPYTAGGPIDVVSRIVTKRLGEVLGHPIIIENRPGAAGMIANKVVAAAEPGAGGHGQVHRAAQAAGRSGPARARRGGSVESSTVLARGFKTTEKRAKCES